MIIIKLKKGEPIERALKRYKRKHRDIGVVKELRNRQQFTKPSEKKRHTKQKAKYNHKKRMENED
tara:strand:+ start:313 stop:507 length:195 start_codon:yes stop_codon:yes gene_type:complete